MRKELQGVYFVALRRMEDEMKRMDAKIAEKDSHLNEIVQHQAQEAQVEMGVLALSMQVSASNDHATRR